MAPSVDRTLHLICTPHYNTLCPFDMSASLYLLLLLVICRVYLTREYHRNIRWPCRHLNYHTTSSVPVYPY